MDEPPPRPPFPETATSNEADSLSKILHKNPALVGASKLRREKEALEYAKKLLAKDASPTEKQQLKAAWDWRDGQYAEWRRKCREFDKAQRAALEKPRVKRQRTRPESVREAEAAAKDKEELKAYLEEMQANHEKDPEGVAAQFKRLIDDESTRPAIEAIVQHGMCECAEAHGNLCAWILMMWMAATRFRMEHGDAAPERLASMNDGAVSSYLVDRLKEIPNLEGDVRAQLEAAASGALRFMDVSWPPRAEFHEATSTPVSGHDLVTFTHLVNLEARAAAAAARTSGVGGLGCVPGDVECLKDIFVRCCVEINQCVRVHR